ncbi:MAG: DUF2950 family protein [Planctomycetes bacterium]|nr:DUF2950 family protein [Planctomycetota bacterium]
MRTPRRILACTIFLLAAGALHAAEEAKSADKPDDAEIARNESAAIAACKTFAEAEDIYRRTDWDADGVLEYAQAFKGNNSLYEKNEGKGDLTLIDKRMAEAGVDVVLKLPDDKEIPAATPEEAKAFEEAFAKLGADDYQERENATARLKKIGAGAIKLLDKAVAESKDAEIRQRCQTLALHLKEDLARKLDKKGLGGTPFNGYLFKVLKGQGPGAPGGKKSYVNNGNMTLGYAVIAFPAAYGKSGRKTFQINNTGTVYEKDNGAETQTKAEATEAYDPAGWIVTE